MTATRPSWRRPQLRRFELRRPDLRRLDPRGLELGPIEPYWQRSRLWWVDRSLREQLLIGALATAGIFAALLLLVIVPLQAERADALARIRAASLLEARLHAAGGADLATTTRMRRGNASAILTDSVSAARLTIQQIEPEGSETRVVIGDAPFEQVLQWLADLEATSRLRVVQAQIERKAAGVVSTTLVIAS